MDSSEIFQHAADAMVLIMESNGNFKFIDMNNAFTELVGYSKGELLRMSPMDLSPSRGSRHFEMNLKKLKGKDSCNMEAQWIGKNRASLHLELNVNSLKLRKLPCYLLVAREVSEKGWMLKEARSTRNIVAAGLLDRENYVSSLHQFDSDSYKTDFRINTELMEILNVEDRSRLLRILRSARKSKLKGDFVFSCNLSSRGGALRIRLRLCPFENGRGRVIKLAFTASVLPPSNDEKEPLSSRLRKAMIDYRISNETLSERTGISLGTISKLRNGKIKEPRKKTLMQLSRVLGNDF